MSDDVIESEVGHDEYTGASTAVESEQRFIAALPDRQNLDGSKALIEELGNHTNQRGIPTLAKFLAKYVRQTELSNDHWDRVQSACNYVNGVRSVGQKKGDYKRSLRNDAEDFYESLSTPVLRLHCKLFNIDYDSYGSMEEVIARLVQTHVDMVGV